MVDENVDWNGGLDDFMLSMRSTSWLGRDIYLGKESVSRFCKYLFSIYLDSVCMFF